MTKEWPARPSVGTDHPRVSLLDGPLTRQLLERAAWPADQPVELLRAWSVDSNSRAMLELRYTAAEMSFATYLHARFVDNLPLVALPAFTGRRFLPGHIGVAPGSPLRGPDDLRGKRVAVPQYWMTSSVWHRSILRRFYGIDSTELTWVTTAAERFQREVHGVRVEHIWDGRSPADLVLDGDADVLLSPRSRPLALKPLFADENAEAERFHRETGVVPIMHLVVLHADEALAQPRFVAALWAGLLAAREAAFPGPPVPGISAIIADGAADSDPWAYGIEPNRRSLEFLLAETVTDGLLNSQPDLNEVFGLMLPTTNSPVGPEPTEEGAYI